MRVLECPSVLELVCEESVVLVGPRSSYQHLIRLRRKARRLGSLTLCGLARQPCESLLMTFITPSQELQQSPSHERELSKYHAIRFEDHLSHVRSPALAKLSSRHSTESNSPARIPHYTPPPTVPP